MQEPTVKSFFDPDTGTVTHVVCDSVTRRAAIIDSVLDYDPKSGRTSHASADRVVDHFSAAPYLRDKLGGKIAVGRHIREVQAVFKKLFNAKDMSTDGIEFDHLFDDGELEVRVIHTPGHTPACLTFVLGKDAFIGDTLFMPDYGSARCDFPGGDAATLYRSIKKVLALASNTRLHLCHASAAPARSASQRACRPTAARRRQRRQLSKNSDQHILNAELWSR